MTARSILALFSFVFVQTLGTATAFAGTGDLGGGANGINGRPLDSYIKDPRTLPVYIQYLKPIFDHISAEEAAENARTHSQSKDNETSSLADYFAMKTWYFVPKELSEINQNALGVSFGKDGTQQIAHHRDRSIWINTLIFDEMAPADQAMTLLHEFVMAMYFMRFKSMAQICDLSRMANPSHKSCPGTSLKFIRAFDLIYPVEPLHPLNADDYEKIRPMTNWLMINGATATISDIKSMFLAYDFDRRFFNVTATRNDPLQITSKEVVAAFSRAKFGRRMPTRCSGTGNQNLGPCTLEVTEKPIVWTPDAPPVKGLEFIARNGNGDVIASIPAALSDKSSLSEASNFNTGHSLQLLVLVPLLSVTKVQAGQSTYQVYVYFRYDSSQSQPRLEIDSVILRPLVITEVDAANETPCMAEELEEEGLTERPLVMTSTKSTLEPFHRLLPSIFPPFTFCVKP